MNWDCTAGTSEELATITEVLLKAQKQNFLDEQHYMGRMLEALSETDLPSFPVRVRHAGETEVPDYQLKFDVHRIAVEITKIAGPDVECALVLQRKHLINESIGTTELLRESQERRTEDEIVNVANGNQQFNSPVPLAELQSIWFEIVRKGLQKKTNVVEGPQFQHGDED